MLINNRDDLKRYLNLSLGALDWELRHDNGLLDVKSIEQQMKEIREIIAVMSKYDLTEED